MESTPFSISTAISYPNAQPHMGHALEFIQADFLARYYRLQGRPVFFQTGLDEHGLKIFRTAERAGQDPKSFVEDQQTHFRALLEALQVEPDRFIRTSDADHAEIAQALWKRCMDAGDIYKKTYRAWYNVKEETFLGSADDIKDPAVFNIDEKFIELIEEENYFFKLSAYTDRVVAHIESGEYDVVPGNRKTEILNFAKRGLQDISISRERSKLPWGVAVPGDETQVMYVWFDALTNYLTGTSSIDEQGIKTNEFWPYSIHLVGKDILRFHALMWPAMLLSAGLETPKQLMVHGFVLSEGKRMSKSLGNGVDPRDALAMYGADALRWYLLKEIPSMDDGDFTMARLGEIYASDLANDYGNLVSRVTSMSKRYCDGAVPNVGEDAVRNLEKALVEEAWPRYHSHIEQRHIDKALEGAHSLIVFCNRRIEECQPWALAKDPEKQGELHELLYELIEIIRHVSVMVAPAIPGVIAKVRKEVFTSLNDEAFYSSEWGKTVPGMILSPESIILFPRIEA